MIRDQGENLSIVMVGALWGGDLERVANYATHWRSMFPRSEIIISVSISDVVKSPGGGAWLPTRTIANDPWARQQLKCLEEIVDHLVFSEVKIPLPPIKKDSPSKNNGNLQIAVARAGLGAATREYALRIRNDMVFLDRDFILQFRGGNMLKRSQAAVLKSRVLVSPLFTLNPFSKERLPFHVSDWFHLGLTDDLKMIWDLPDIRLIDALWYSHHQHPPHSNSREKLFTTRFAVEQHVMRNLLAKRSITLTYINDVRLAPAYLDLLVDEFVVADLHSSLFVFDKYSHLLGTQEMGDLCVSHQQWRQMVLQPARKQDVLLRPFEPTRAAQGGLLRAGEELGSGEQMISALGRFSLALSPDRRLVIESQTGTIWSQVLTADPNSMIMQSDGNLVVYDKTGGPIWATDTAGNPGAVLSLDDDGDLTVCSEHGILWRNDRTPAGSADQHVSPAT